MPLRPSRAEKWGIESCATASTWTTLDREPRRSARSWTGPGPVGQVDAEQTAPTAPELDARLGIGGKALNQPAKQQ